MLELFSEAELGGALKLCETRAGTFPPGLPEFRSLCVAARNAAQPNVTHERLAREKAEPDSVMAHLEKAAVSPIALREMERMKAILRSEDVESFDASYHRCNLGIRWGERHA